MERERTTRHTPFTRHLTRDFAQLDNMADAVEGLLRSPGWSVVAEVLEGVRADVEQELYNGGRPLESAAEYAIRHGRLEGLASAKLAAEAVIAKRNEARSRVQRSVAATEAAGRSA